MSRGYFRGRGSGGYGSSPWRESKTGFQSSSRGRFYTSTPSTYEPRSRPFYEGGSDRYVSTTSRNHDDDSYPPRSYRQEEYSSHEYGSRNSPEPAHKRVRQEMTSYSLGSSRRSNEHSYNSGVEDYRSPRTYYGEKTGGGGGGGYQGGGDVAEERGPPPSYRSEGRPVMGYRKSLPLRASFRGRGFSRGRGRGAMSGFRRPFSSSSSIFFSRRRPDSFLHKRYLSSSKDLVDRIYRRKLFKRKMQLDDSRGRKSDDEDGEDEDRREDEDDDQESVEGQDMKQDEEDMEDISSQEGREAEEVEEGEVDEEDDRVKSRKVDNKKPIRRAVSKRVANDAVDKSSMDWYIKLACPHCKFDAVTFQEYARHLKLKRHYMAMKLVWVRLRQTLRKMRIDQRNKQRLLDDVSNDDKNLHTLFCKVCKLNYRTLKSEHTATRSHKKMLDFLFPFCKTCKISFKTPMLYESHICELGHIKRKARVERIRASLREKNPNDSANEMESNNFMVLDSVDSGEESDGAKARSSSKTEDKREEGSSARDVEKKKLKKPEPKLGSEHCTVMEAVFCNLCKVFLSPSEDKRKSIISHCQQRSHLQTWMRETKVKKARVASPPKKTMKKDNEPDEEEPEGKEQEDEAEDEEEKKVKIEDQEERRESREFSRKRVVGEEKEWSAMDEANRLSDDEMEDEEENEDEDEDDDASRGGGGGRYDKFKHDKSITVKKPLDKSKANGRISRGEKTRIKSEK